MNENKLKHLEFVQGVINRMARNSFLIKGWSVTLVAAIFALAAKDANTQIVIIAYIPVIVFWFLDTYFLRQERLYRKLYDDVRGKEPSTVDFSLNATAYQKEVASFICVMFSVTLRWFHGFLLIAVIAANYITWRN